MTVGVGVGVGVRREDFNVSVGRVPASEASLEAILSVVCAVVSTRRCKVLPGTAKRGSRVITSVVPARSASDDPSMLRARGMLRQVNFFLAQLLVW